MQIHLMQLLIEFLRILQRHLFLRLNLKLCSKFHL